MMTDEDIADKSNEELRALLLQQARELQNQKAEIKCLHERINQLLQSQYGRQSEKYDYSQQYSLFDEATVEPNEEEKIIEAESDITVAAHTRKTRGRKPLPKDLPRVRVEHDLPEAERTCQCGCQLTKIGEDCSEQLDIIPAKVQVIVHARLKYACKSCEETIKRSPMPPQPIAKSIASPGLLAHVLVSKFKDHLPLYRQEQIFQRMGVDIPRNTLSYWVIRCGDLLSPLIIEMQKIICDYDIAFADETTIQVLKEKDRLPSSKSYMWVFSGGPPEKRSFVYEYHPSRAHDIPRDFFKDFSGYLHTDGYQAYQTLFKTQPIQGVACWMHARRKFMDIVKTIKGNKTGLCHWAVSLIAKLYRVETETKNMMPDERKAYRDEHASPLLKKMKAWLDKKIHTTAPDSPIGKAIAYCLKYWDGLTCYLNDGRLEIDNGASERAIKPFAIGRKNWMFSDTPNGAAAGAVIYSLIETCKAHDIEPYQYFRYILKKIPSCSTEEESRQLLPFNIDRNELTAIVTS